MPGSEGQRQGRPLAPCVGTGGVGPTRFCPYESPAPSSAPQPSPEAELLQEEAYCAPSVHLSCSPVFLLLGGGSDRPPRLVRKRPLH